LERPVLYTAGRYDEATPETPQYYQSLTPGSSLAIFENSSQMAMLEETDRYIQVVRDFLHRVEGK
jgi:proline iminopeptidase